MPNETAEKHHASHPETGRLRLDFQEHLADLEAAGLLVFPHYYVLGMFDKLLEGGCVFCWRWVGVRMIVIDASD